MDKNLFFKNATLRICGNLDIEKAIQSFLRYLQNFVPASMISFHTIDFHPGAFEAVFIITPEKTQSLSIKTVLTDKARRRFKKEVKSIEALKGRTMGMPRLFRFNDLLYLSHHEEFDERPIGIALFRRMSDAKILGHHFEKMGVSDLPGIVIELVVKREVIGILLVSGEKGEVFTDEHISLLTMLNAPFSIAFSNSLRYRKLQAFKDRLVDEKKYLQEELLQRSGKEIVGADNGLKRVMALVNQVAPLGSPVLLIGETGTGKELISSAIHHVSDKKDGPFIKVNCGAIPASLMDSELFGHEKGSFTGAITQKRGLFERADRGTIFLDEIAELSAEAQVRLLRVLQEKEIERVGGGTPVQLDIRIIAATHQNLEDMVDKGRFREDLYFRIRVFPITIPPLRERTQDIPALVNHFLEKKKKELNLTGIPRLTPGAMGRLISYSWPGNVRELENAVERELIVSNGKPLSFNNVGFSSQGVWNGTPDLNEVLDLNEVMAGHIRKVLERCNGQVEGPNGAARLMNINPSTLRKRMRKRGIPFGRKAKKAKIM